MHGVSKENHRRQRAIEAEREIAELVRKTGMAVRSKKTGMSADEEQARPIRSRRTTEQDFIEGRHIPDEAHIHICLNCKKKNCTGRCKEVGAARGGRKRKEVTS